MKTIHLTLVTLAAFLTLAIGQTARASFVPCDLPTSDRMSFWFSPESLNDTISQNPQYTNGQAITKWDNTDTVSTILEATSSRDATNPGDSSAPTYLDAAHGINGHAAARFDGVNDYLDAPTSGMGGQNTIFVVFRTTSTDSTKDYGLNAAQNLLGDNSGSTVVWGLGVTGGNAELNGYNSAFSSLDGAPVSNGAPHFMTAMINNDNYGLAVDGGTAATATFTGASTYDYLLRFHDIGAGYGSGAPTHGDFFTGDIAEIIVFNTVLSPTDTALVNNYLTEKYLPEPASLTLLAVGGLALIRRRGRAQEPRNA